MLASAFLAQLVISVVHFNSNLSDHSVLFPCDPVPRFLFGKASAFPAPEAFLQHSSDSRVSFQVLVFHRVFTKVILSLNSFLALLKILFLARWSKYYDGFCSLASFTRDRNASPRDLRVTFSHTQARVFLFSFLQLLKISVLCCAPGFKPVLPFLDCAFLLEVCQFPSAQDLGSSFPVSTSCSLNIAFLLPPLQPNVLRYSL